jgi:CBS domain-containing protein
MPTAHEILRQKSNNGLVTISATATIREAARAMKEKQVTALLIVAADGVIDGILTEHDILVRVIGDDKPSATTRVGDVMTRTVIVVEPHRPIEEVEAIMQQHHISDVPVAGEKGLAGVLTIFDLIAYHASKHQQQAQMLTDYIYGRH